MKSESSFSRITHHASRPPIRAITFDVGGTLIEPWPSVGHVYAAIAARHGFHELSAEVLNRQFASAWKKLSGFNYTRPEWFEIVNQSFAGLTRTPLSEILFADLYSHFGRAEAWRIFDDVLPALESLRSRGLKLGIISNWDERLRPLLHELKLDRFFQTIVISCEAGACKPSATIFNRAAEFLGFPPASILHIGDDPVLDVAGAKSAGFQGLLARDPGKPPQTNSLALLDSVLFPM
jgi:putative hydrolase of the HAD superfamily